ncbi:MAG: phosphopyruvate hydratase [Euryarchaeota archaeon]|nr:phosphopyruvate hydratase [Euryarchaeota archaeon]
MARIRRITPRLISDSRGRATIEIDLETPGGRGRAAAPSGASTGAHEAASLPPERALRNARLLAGRLRGKTFARQEALDAWLREADGTSNFRRLGANLTVALSMAYARAQADARGTSLYRTLGLPPYAIPTPLGNVINGGAHARGSTSIQEFLSIPEGARGARSKVMANAGVHRRAGELLHKKHGPCGKGDEGGWSPSITDDQALRVLQQAARAEARERGVDIRLGLDIAATSLWDGRAYRYRNITRSPEAQRDYVARLARKYRLRYVEDPLHEEDYTGFARLTHALRDTDVRLCGDDLFVTNPERIARGIRLGAANTVLIKPNQIGTLTDTRRAVETARRAGYTCVLSHRSGETTDETIAHLAVGWHVPYIKTGIVGGERIAKLNELIRIEEELG